ncbi:phage tail protein [Salisaeta longa]|uniref:phage tail protein n=1 Tax=Salisaeta longa TaxID=503170 RepID=UPI0003B31F7D
MSEPFVGEVRIFAGTFAPRGWAFCNGQLLPISQNTALFSLLGTTYGGDGRTTLALPDLQGRAPMHPGRGPGLADRQLGEATGTDAVALTNDQMPRHTHEMKGIPFPGNAARGGAFAKPADGTPLYRDGASNATMGVNTTTTGGGQAHNNRQPYLALHFIIALVGLYPSRS